MNQITPKQGFFQPLAAGIIAFLFLAWLAWPQMPYEEDSIAKAGKILSMQQPGHLFKPVSTQNYYHDEMFGLYYIILSCVHAVIGGNVFREMNLASAVAGGIFCGLISPVLRKVFSIPVWLTLLLALNTPAFLHVFSFGNEAAFALAAFALTFYLLTQPEIGKNICAGIFLGLGFHCRPDIIFLTPLLLAWTWLRSEKKVALKMCAIFGTAASLTAAAFWLIFVRKMPTETGYVVTFVPKYFAAILCYPFAPALIPVVLCGVIYLFRTRSWNAAAIFSSIVPLLYSVRGLSSPKYIAILMLPLWVAAGTALIRRGWKLKLLTFFLVAIFWTCSVTPFGLRAGADGAIWFLPTEHGPIPTGSYAFFYRNVHDGIYQQRRAAEITQAEELFPIVEKSPNDVVIGFFNPQTVLFVKAEKNDFENAYNFPWQTTTVSTNHPCLLIKTSYLRLATVEDGSQKILRQWFADGRVRKLAGSDADPFPDVIETGAQIPVGENAELGRRILFGLERGKGNGYIRRKLFNAEVAATSWLPTAQKSNALPSIAYADSEFVACTNDVGGINYCSIMPLNYYHLTDPRSNPNFASSGK